MDVFFGPMMSNYVIFLIQMLLYLGHIPPWVKSGHMPLCAGEMPKNVYRTNIHLNGHPIPGVIIPLLIPVNLT